MTVAPPNDSFAPVIGAALDRAGGGSRWVVESHQGPWERERWLMVRHAGVRLPDQGWKLHVSAGVAQAAETLRRAVAALLEEPLAFKVAASPDALGALNEGRGTLTQVGKFITVYPVDDAQAVRVAAALARATEGLRGPRVPSDRPLRAGSVVHYRYGGFGGLTVQQLNGEITFAIRDPTGGLVPDRRAMSYSPPDWADDPFVAAGVAERDLQPASPLVGGRFLLVDPLYLSARGGVYLAVDLDRPATCVLKKATGGATDAAAGDGLRNEAEVLRRLAAQPAVPAVVDLVTDGDDLYLVLEDVRGETVEDHVLGLSRRGCTVDGARVVEWGRELAAILTDVHAAGYVYRDLKSTNVLVADGHIRLVDFELACPPGGGATIPGLGTRGYISPQQAAGAPPSVGDDVYGFGALLFHLATGAEPSQAPAADRLLDRPVRLLNPRAPAAVEAVVARCLAPAPGDRFGSVAEAAAALSSAGSPPPFRPTAVAPGAWLDMSRRIGDTLRRLAQPAGAGWVTWASSHPVTQGIPARDLNAGAAGTVLALAELVDEVGGEDLHRLLRAGAGGLAASARPGGAALPGLYVGEAGVAAALLRAGQVLDDPELVEQAGARARVIDAMEHCSPDLFHGSAGRLRFHLLLWDETGAEEHLAAAVAAGRFLLATAEDAGAGALRWRIPAGYGGTSNQAYIGYAHGAAGIGDALLDLLDATGDTRYAGAAAGAGRWIERAAVPVLDDGSGLGWPATEGEDVAAAYWCHGAAGVARFLRHAAAVDLWPGCDELAGRALDAAAFGARWAPPPQCHGLTGAIEVLLDAHQSGSGDGRLDQALDLGLLLRAFALKEDEMLAWPSETPLVVSPDYAVGFAGVLATLLRLADPHRRPHGLSRKGFRHRAHGGPGR